MASLALFFSMNSAIGCPFILLDEVDANLDKDHAERYFLSIFDIIKDYEWSFKHSLIIQYNLYRSRTI